MSVLEVIKSEYPRAPPRKAPRGGLGIFNRFNILNIEYLRFRGIIDCKYSVSRLLISLGNIVLLTVMNLCLINEVQGNNL